MTVGVQAPVDDLFGDGAVGVGGVDDLHPELDRAAKQGDAFVTVGEFTPDAARPAKRIVPNPREGLVTQVQVADPVLAQVFFFVGAWPDLAAAPVPQCVTKAGLRMATSPTMVLTRGSPGDGADGAHRLLTTPWAALFQSV